MAYIQGRDVSSWNPEHPDYAGYDFVVVKVTEGTTYVNPNWDTQVADARALGMVVGHYHFASGTGTVSQQVAHFLSKAPSREDEFLVLDWEDTSLTAAEKDAFLDSLKTNRPHQRILLYCNKDFWNNIDVSDKFGDGLWIADWQSPAGSPTGINDPWTIHQYTDTPIDKNVAKFQTRSEFAQWVSNSSTPPPSSTTVKLSNVQYGNTSNEVTTVQQKLINLGFSIPAGATGYFGDQTKAAYTAWEQSRGMALTNGVPGCSDLTALGSNTTAPVFSTSCDIPDPDGPPPSGTVLKLSDVQYAKTNAAVTTAQQKLIALGFSIPAGATGYFGDQTKSAWTAWEQTIDVTTVDGVPGCYSLTELGSRPTSPTFSTSCDIPDPSGQDNEPAHVYTRGTFGLGGGKIINQRTKTMIDRAVVALADSYAWAPYITQGSYNPGGVSGSAGTHDGGGVIDIRTSTMTTHGQNLCVQALREVGFAAWLRTPAEGFTTHIHAVAIGDREMSGAAANQVQAFFNGRNGLANNGPDTLPSTYQVAWPSWCNKYNF